VPGANNNTASISALTNGTEYEFEVLATYTPSGEGPESNRVTATPLGPIGTPVVTAMPGNQEVALSWTAPSDGGHVINAYSILWRPAGTTDWIGAKTTSGNPPATQTTITGLKNGTEYEFAVAASATNGDFGPQGLATATPHGDIGTVDRNPDERLEAINQSNNPRYWERAPYNFGHCTKFEDGDDYGSVWEITGGENPSALILKSDGINDVWESPEAGMYGTASAKDISHAIVCTR
jgi:hypothetical protein